MKQKHLRIFRLFISLIFLVAFTVIFIDFREIIPTAWVHLIHDLQFIPSIINFVAIMSVSALGFLIVLILTLLFGRVYCSTLCPMGILQDVFTFISRKLSVKTHFKYSRPLNFIRYGFLVLSLVSLVFGSLLTLYLLDPYSNFGRIFSNLVRPVVISLNNLMAGLFMKMNLFFLYKVDFKGFELREALFPVVMLAVILWLSLTRGRLFCNTVCPVGTLLGILSRLSLFRIKIDKFSCTRCGKCSVVCKSSCINVKTMEVDFSRCVGCFNCLTVCAENSIHYKLNLSAKKARSDEPSKREFLSKSMVFFLAMAGLNSRQRIRKGMGGRSISIEEKRPVSPPGSLSLKHFNDYCTACHLCVTTCPSQVLQPSFLEYGFTSMLQPHMDFNTGFCEYECTKCSEVCPTGAILPLTIEDKKLTQIGKVHFVIEDCIVYTDETACGSCSEHCPTQAVRMVPYKPGLTIPEIHPSTCIGCGACEHVCPARPRKAIFVDGSPVHRVAKEPEFKELDYSDTEEFPF
ncbi:MAG: 4Fe-4S dicluster domain-containing protein [Bacteroidales bacterium]|nr:4Fe-4S dicluster domain-containing protein [Bacteroidales bacterium]MBN2762782.1 4Fe-4S dicluster domain-containing protein [Bacteroidales bacterium]